MNKDYKNPLDRLANGPAWKQTLFDLIISFTLLLIHALDFWYYLNIGFSALRRPFAKRTIQRAHYIGSDIQRPHKLAVSLLWGVLIGGVVQAYPNVEKMMIWSLVWGTTLSVIVTYKSIKRWLEIMSFIGPGRKKAV